MHAEEIASSRLLLNTVGAQPLQAYTDAVLGPSTPWIVPVN
jgi:purine catabolism regulator